MKKVRNSVILIIIWLDGVCCKFIVWCRIDIIIMMWVNEVIKIIMVGKKLSMVISVRICRFIE